MIGEGEQPSKIQLSLSNMIVGDFGAGTAMITFGAVLGKANLQQLMVLTTWEMIFWGLNEAIGAVKISATDMGGSIFVHTFGAQKVPKLVKWGRDSAIATEPLGERG